MKRNDMRMEIYLTHISKLKFIISLNITCFCNYEIKKITDLQMLHMIIGYGKTMKYRIIYLT